MTLDGALARWSSGWRGPAVAAFIAFLAGLPGLIAMPPLDRDEARFAEPPNAGAATVVIRFQDGRSSSRWASTAAGRQRSGALSPGAPHLGLPRPLAAGRHAGRRGLRLGRRSAVRAETGLIAGALMGASLLVSTEAFIAKTDSAMTGAVTLAMAALARLYAARRGGPPATRSTVWIFWGAIAASILIKGPVGPMVAILAMIALAVSDRSAGWLGGLKWYWGLIVILAVVGPWAGAVTVATDGAFWTQAVASDLAPKLAGGQETHGAPFGYHALLTPILAFPLTLLLPTARQAMAPPNEPGVRFALA